MPDAKSRAKVQRLLRGDFRAGDLTDLFIFARDHCDGRETVKDIGDFVAHHNVRDRGIITRGTREWFTVVHFHLPRLMGTQPKPLDGQNLPQVTREYLKIAVNRIGPKFITENTKLRSAEASKMASALAQRLKQNADGTWALPPDITKAEISLFQCLASLLVAKPAFDDTRLADDFLTTLKSNGLIAKDEIAAHKDDLSAVVKLYAVAAMHNCKVKMDNGETVQLKATIHNGSDCISVACPIFGVVPNKPDVAMMADMFTANLSPKDHCDPELISHPEWDFELEVSPDRKLTPLR